MPSQITLKALGLNTSPNGLDVPDGSLIEANNVIIQRDNVIEPRRGFKLYGDAFGDTSDRAKQLLTYKERILRHYASTLQFQNGLNNDGSVNFDSFSGSFAEAATGLRIKNVESNGNLYFTTDLGIKKISALNGGQLSTASGYVTQAGGVKAIDLSSRLKTILGDESGFFTQDSAVAYRVVWGIKDANNNLILGTPSQRSELYNPLSQLLLGDLSRVLYSLDNLNVTNSLITDADYSSTLSLPDSTSASEIRTNLIALASKLDTDILYANDSGTGAPLDISAAAVSAGVCTITFSSGDPTQYLSAGSEIFLAGFVSTGGNAEQINGAQTVLTVNSTTITFDTTSTTTSTTITAGTINSNEYRSLNQPPEPAIPATNTNLEAIQSYLQAIITQLQIEPSTVIPTSVATAYIDILDLTTSTTVILEISIPSEITSDYFFQIYRSPLAIANGAVVLSTDVFPSDELQLVYEAYPMASELAAGLVIVNDITPDAFLGANLYINPSSGEGIAQANDIPPFAKDINRFKNSVFYANTRTRYRYTLNLIGVQNMIDQYTSTPTNPANVTFTDGTTTNTYSFINGLPEITEITCLAKASVVASSYFLLNSANDTNLYYVWYNVSGSDADPAISNRTGIEVDISTLGISTAPQVAEKTRDAINVYLNDFIATSSTSKVTVTNTVSGYTTNAADVNTTFTIAVTQQGQGERATQQISKVICVADVSANLAGKYFTLNTAFDINQYYVWYRVSGVGTDPAISGKTGIVVDITINDGASTVATKTKTALDVFTTKFSVDVSTATLTITNYNFGNSTSSSAGTSGFTVTTNQEGALEILLSNSASPSVAVDETARSFVKVINKNTHEIVSAFYLSGAQDVPGKMLLEARTLSNTPFYIQSDNLDTGSSFNPDISPAFAVSGASVISVANPTILTVSTGHGLTNLDQVVISGSNCTPSIDGLYTATVIDSTHFSIPVSVTDASGADLFAFSKATLTQIAENEEKIHRIYYSKKSQPEAVPILNYFDVGASDKAILRIFPLGDTLFVFKEDGLYRISGEGIPFALTLFDSSIILTAPDSVAVMNNAIYCWTTQGICQIVESGGGTISRRIDNQIIQLGSAIYPNFKTITWGLGYESDNTYSVFTNTSDEDVVPTIVYTYCKLTDAWTTYDITATCGIINPADDKIYLGAGDTNYIEQERKNFDRTDYADREFTVELTTGNYFGDSIILQDSDNIDVGDVLVQEQQLTIYQFNSLLKKLDNDLVVNDTNYYSTLVASGGDSLRLKILDLATKLDSDSGITPTDFLSTIDSKSGSISSYTTTNPTVITSNSHGLLTGRVITIGGDTGSMPDLDGTYVITVIDANTFSIPQSITVMGSGGTWTTQNADFRDIKACYNEIIDKLNDDSLSYSNYSEVTTTTSLEVIVTEVNKYTHEITLNTSLNYVLGIMTIYKTYTSSVIYAPNSMGDQVNFKQIREATIMFADKAFTSATLSFSTDLLPAFKSINFNGDGNGIFGQDTFGNGFFGGGSHSSPFRTYIPAQCQRCRYIVTKFTHNIARESFAIYGVTLTGEIGLSTRAYR